MPAAILLFEIIGRWTRDHMWRFANPCMCVGGSAAASVKLLEQITPGHLCNPVPLVGTAKIDVVRKICLSIRKWRIPRATKPCQKECQIVFTTATGSTRGDITLNQCLLAEATAFSIQLRIPVDWLECLTGSRTTND